MITKASPSLGASVYANQAPLRESAAPRIDFQDEISPGVMARGAALLVVLVVLVAVRGAVDVAGAFCAMRTAGDAARAAREASRRSAADIPELRTKGRALTYA